MDDDEVDPAWARREQEKLIRLWLPPSQRRAKLGILNYNGGNLRTYSLGDAACDIAVQMAKQGTIAVDIETDGLAEESFTVKVIIIANGEHACVLDAFNPKHVTAAKEAFERATTLVFHNSPFDVPPLYFCGAFTLDMIDKVTDTLVIARMAFTDGMAGRGLGDLEQSVLGMSAGKAQKDAFAHWCKINKMSKSEGFKRATYQDSAYTLYAGWDGVITFRLLEPLLELALLQQTTHPFGRYGASRSEALELIKREQIQNRITLWRTVKGLTFDAPKMAAEQNRILDAQSDNKNTLESMGVTEPTNRNQLIAALLADEVFPEDYPVTAKTGKPSTAAKYLKKLDHPLIEAFYAYDSLNRSFNYLETSRKIAERTDGRLHPTVGIMKAVTGRMSYSNPATHQFTADAREMIMGDELESGDYDQLTSIDWSQVEPVITANLSNDTLALETYEGSGDLYAAAMEYGGVSRKDAKVVVLAMLYQQGLRSLAKSLNVSMKEAAEVRRKVSSAMPMTDLMTAWAVEWSRVAGKTWTLSGRIVNVDPRSAYKGANYVVQGSSYDMLADAMVEAYCRGMGAQFYLAQHDEVIVSKSIADEFAEIMRTPSERFKELSGRTPLLRVDMAHLGSRWRTPPKDGCGNCGSETALSYQRDVWTCADHRLIAA